jgi:hypothetical protein
MPDEPAVQPGALRLAPGDHRAPAPPSAAAAPHLQQLPLPAPCKLEAAVGCSALQQRVPGCVCAVWRLTCVALARRCPRVTHAGPPHPAAQPASSPAGCERTGAKRAGGAAQRGCGGGAAGAAGSRAGAAACSGLERGRRRCVAPPKAEKPDPAASGLRAGGVHGLRAAADDAGADVPVLALQARVPGELPLLPPAGPVRRPGRPASRLWPAPGWAVRRSCERAPRRGAYTCRSRGYS